MTIKMDYHDGGKLIRKDATVCRVAVSKRSKKVHEIGETVGRTPCMLDIALGIVVR